MRVNDGTVKFCDFDDNGKKILPTRQDDMESLIRRAFENDIIEVTDDETGQVTVKRKNIQRQVIENKVKQALYKTGRNRLVETEYTDGDVFSFNPFDDYEALKEERDSFIAQFNKTHSKLVDAIMYTISFQPNDVYRKCLIAYFMNSGVHIKCKDSFRLKVDFSKKDIKAFENQYDKPITEQIKVNEEINQYIEECIEEFEGVAKPCWEEFYDKVLKYAKKNNRDTLLYNIQAYSNEILNATNTSNLYRDTFAKWTDDYGEPLVSQSAATAIRRDISDLRKTLRQTINIPRNQAYYYLNYSRKQEQRCLPEALNWLKESYGENLGIGDSKYV